MSDGAAAVFLAALPPGRAGTIDRDRLAIQLERLWREVEAARPGFAIGRERFVAGLARAVGEADAEPATEVDVERALGSIAAVDLYLAIACRLGDPAALAAFHAELGPTIAARVGRLLPGSDAAAEIIQELMTRLFVGGADGRPRIDHYTGRGSLRVWISVVAARAAIDQRRRQDRQLPLADSVVERIATLDEDAEVTYLRTTYAAEFKAALAEAIEGLSARDRLVLRYSLDGRTAEEIGRILRAHRVTVARWLPRIRGELTAATRAALRRSLQVDGAELDSILRVIAGQIDLSLGGLLPNAPPVD